jgi:peroxiredoxin
MRKELRQWMGWVVILAVAVLLGCRSEPEKPAAKSDGASTEGKDQVAKKRKWGKTKAEEPIPEKMPETESAPPAKINPVELTEADRATCVVKEGDKMPTAELADVSDKPQPLAGLLGKKLTVVVFWSADGVAGLQALQDLTSDVADPYAKQDVRVVGVNVRNTAAEVKEKTELAGATFPNLLDPKGEFFAKVATERLPRVYVLDAAGKILWFDIGYSPATRSNLLQAVRAKVGEPGQ